MFRINRPRKSDASRSPRRPHRALIRLEGLEPRLLLTNYVVNDNGHGSLDTQKPHGETSTGMTTLYSAIQQVNMDGGGTITFQSSMTINIADFAASENGPASMDALPAITASGVTIDGSVGTVKIINNVTPSTMPFQLQPAMYPGLILTGSGDTIENLQIAGFLGGGIAVVTNGNLIETNTLWCRRGDSLSIAHDLPRKPQPADSHAPRGSRFSLFLASCSNARYFGPMPVFYFSDGFSPS